MVEIQYAHITVTAVIGIAFPHILALRAILPLHSLSLTISFLLYYFYPIFLIILLIRFLTFTAILIILIYILAFFINGKGDVLLRTGRKLVFIFELKVNHLLAEAWILQYTSE